MGPEEIFLRGGDEVWLLLRKMVTDDVSKAAAIVLDFEIE